MEKHFCPCPDETCANHPARHGEGCDACIRKNLKTREMPACFFMAVSPEVGQLTSFTFESFVDFYNKHNAAER